MNKLKKFLFIINILIFINPIFVNCAQVVEQAYTKEEMQKMIVSTALSYWYNNSYSNYGQTGMDGIGDNTNFLSSPTLYWRDLSVTPEMPSRSNYYNIDCSGFTFISYLNTFGYNMSQYKSVNTYNLFDNNNNLLYKVNDGTKNINIAYKEAYTKYGQGWNNNYMLKSANKIMNNCKYAECLAAQKTIINTSITDKNELVAYIVDASEKTNEISKEDWIENWKEIREKLEPGDIVMYKRREKDGSIPGHVMMYVGNAFGKFDENSLIHSTGADYNSHADSLNNKLYKSTSILKSIVKKGDEIQDDYIVNRINEIYKSSADEKLSLHSLVVFRPINTMKDEDGTFKLSVNENNINLSDKQLSNNKARVEFNDLSFEQWITNNKSNQSSKILSKYNSVYKGESLLYKLRVKKEYNSNNIGYTFSIKLPKNTQLEKVMLDNVGNVCDEEFTEENTCKYTYDESSKTISITENTEDFNGSYRTYILKLGTLSAGKISFEGVKIISNDTGNTLHMADNLSINVLPYEYDVERRITNAVKMFEEWNTDGVLIEHNSNSANGYANYFEDIQDVVSVSQFGFIKMIYYNALNLDLGNAHGDNDLFLSTENIINTFFDGIDENSNTITSPHNNISKSIAYKFKTSQLDDVNMKLIKKMLVPGMYGGNYLKGNDSNDRIKFLRSFKNSYGNNTDFEIGDIIVSYNGSYAIYTMYLGFDDYGPVLARFTSDGLIKYTDKYLTESDYDSTCETLKNANEKCESYALSYSGLSEQDKKILKPSNQILNEIFSEKLFVILRPSQIPVVNYRSSGIGKMSSTVVYENIAKKLNKNIFINEGYTFKGWSTSLNGEVVYQDEEEVLDIALVENQTLYAVWEANKYTVVYNANSGRGTMKNSTFIYDNEQALSKNLFTKEGYKFKGWSTVPSGFSKYQDEQVVKNLSTTGTINLYAVWEEVKEEDIEKIINTKYQVKNNNIYKIPKQTVINNLELGLNSNYLYKIYNETNTNIIGQDYIGTGNILKVYMNDTLKKEYRVIIKGDLTGEGEIEVNDVARLYQYIKGKTTMSDYYREAANVEETNSDLAVSDVAKLYQYIKGKINNL